MTPQHYLTAAALIGPAETTTGTHVLALGYCHIVTFDPGKPASFGHVDPDARFCTLGPVSYPERYDAWETDPAKAQAHALTEWITEEHGHHNFKGSIDSPTNTGDTMAIYYDRDDRPRVDLRTWGQPDTATTTQSALKWRIGAGRIVQPPEFAPPHFETVWLDIAFVGWTWEKIAGTHKP